MIELHLKVKIDADHTTVEVLDDNNKVLASGRYISPTSAAAGIEIMMDSAYDAVRYPSSKYPTANDKLAAKLFDNIASELPRR